MPTLRSQTCTAVIDGTKSVSHALVTVTVEKESPTALAAMTIESPVSEMSVASKDVDVDDLLMD